MIEGWLLDTSVVSAFVLEGHKHNETVRTWMAARREPLYLSVVSIGELEYGIANRPSSPGSDGLRKAASEFMALPLNREAAVVYGKTKAALFGKYSPRTVRGRNKDHYPEDLRDVTGKTLGIQENDLWLVSVAQAHRLRFATLDRRGGMRRVVECAGFSADVAWLGNGPTP